MFEFSRTSLSLVNWYEVIISSVDVGSSAAFEHSTQNMAKFGKFKKINADEKEWSSYTAPLDTWHTLSWPSRRLIPLSVLTRFMD